MENKRSLETAECDYKMGSEEKKPEFERGEEERSVRLPEGSRLRERLLNALESGLWADCKFHVGESKEEVKACKMILSLASPVFSTMFFGGVSETGPVLVPDVEPDVFKKLLQFIYTHNVQMSSIEQALKVMVAADKYMLPDLIDICLDFCILNIIENKAKMRDLCTMLEIAKLLNLEKLQEASIKKAQEVAATLFSSAEFLTLSADSLVSILRRGHLKINSELQLINAALGWASNRCDQRDISAEGKALRSVLEEVGAFKHLRFLNLTPQELQTFESDPKKRGVLTAGEMEAIRKHHYSINDEPPPDSICNLSKPRDYGLSDFHRELLIREGKSLQKITSHETVTETLDNLDLSSATPYGVTIATQVGESEHGYYEEELRVNVSYGLCNKYDISGYFKGFVKYKDKVTVPLECRGKSFNGRISVEITFCKSGIYPVFRTLDKCRYNVGHIIKLHYS